MDDRLVARLYTLAKGERWRAPRERFAAALDASIERACAGRPASAREVERYLSGLHLDDLAFACACAAGDEDAWGHFVLEYRPTLQRGAETLDARGGAGELADALYAELFGLGGGAESARATSAGVTERPALFLRFYGRSSLAAWLRAVLAQRFVDQRRARCQIETGRGGGLSSVTTPRGEHEPGREQRMTLLHKTLAAAVAALSPLDRLRLVCACEQELPPAVTGRLLREPEAAVPRQLARTRKMLREAVEQRLSSDEGLSKPEVAECFASVVEAGEASGPDEALDRALRHDRPAIAGATTDSCLDPEVMAAWPEGRLAGDALELAQAHVADCSRCQMAMGAFLRAGAQLSDVAVDRPRRSALAWVASLALASVVIGAGGWLVIRQAALPASPSPQTTPGLTVTRSEPVAAPSRGPSPLESTQSAGASGLPVAPPVIELGASNQSVRWRLSGGVVERSTDSGAAWAPAAVGVNGALAAGAAPSSSVCWVVGAGGVVVLSTDGSTWRRVAFPEPVDLIAVHAIDARTATVTTTDGRAFRTTDSGSSWVKP